MLVLRRARRCVTAWVRRTPYERDGVIVRGAWHFAPDAKVYVEPPFSGDGWERAYMVGRHRETGRWTRVIGPRSRLRGFHVEEVTDASALDLLRDCAAWEDFPPNREWMERIEAASLAPRLLPWTDDAWRDAVLRAWMPARPQLVAHAAKVLGCAEATVDPWAYDGTLGARLQATQMGRWSPPGAGPALRSPEAAWELLAPVAWVGDPARRFVTVHSGDEPDAPAAFPTGLSAVVSFTSDVANVTAVEELAREIASALALAPARDVVWRVGSLAAAQGHLERVADTRMGEATPAARALRLGRALLRDDDELAAAVVREDPATASRAWSGLFELASRGYAALAFDEGRAELLAVDLPRPRIRDGAW